MLTLQPVCLCPVIQKHQESLLLLPRYRSQKTESGHVDFGGA